MTFRRLAVADRGGPAIRCLIAVADLNAQSAEHITTIALHCDADRASWFVRAADEEAPLGVDTPTAVDVDAIIRAATAAHADALWVGWNPLVPPDELTARCEAAGITMVGPGSDVLARIPDDPAAKQLADDLGIPTVGWQRADADDADAVRAAAAQVGFPLVVRTGGRRTRLHQIVSDLAMLPEAARAAADEVASRDVTRDVVLEQWVPHARQLEVQIVADSHGNVWPLGVRDGSVQRMREKVLQESRCTAIDPATESALQADAVRFAQALGYVGVCTLEFLVDLDTGTTLFRTFHPRLQAGHPVTEATTGVDLVGLTLRVARGDRLEGAAPEPAGHALGVRLLATDPERSFAPAGGSLAVLRLPVGGGIRVDTGYTEGDVVDAASDPLLATLVASGRDRGEALARLRRALTQLIVVIDGGTTTKAVVARELETPAIHDGSYDCAWLDGVVAAGMHLPPPDPLALLVAATAAYDVDEAAVREQFLASAARGRPTLPDGAGLRVDLRMRGHSYRLHVYRTGPAAYRVDTGRGVFDLSVQALGGYERAVSCSGHQHRVVVAEQRGRIHVEVDGVPHVVVRDDGLVVRAALPAFVADVDVHVGDRVGVGDVLMQLESMKMLTVVTAPVDGTVAAVPAGAHTQVEVGAPLVVLSPVHPVDTAVGTEVDLSTLTPVRPPADGAGVHALLRAELLGYDLDPATAAKLPAAQRRLAAGAAPADPVLLAHEIDLLEIYADTCALSRREPDSPEAGDLSTASAQEHLFTYLSRLDPVSSGVPRVFLTRLQEALARYGVTSLGRSPELEQAVVHLYRSFLRSRQLSDVVVGVLDRWLRHQPVLVDRVGDRQRAVLSRLVHVLPGRADAVADLAREVHYRFVDEPLLNSSGASADARVGEAIAGLVDAPDQATAERLVEELVWCPRPLRPRLRDAWLGAGAGGRGRLLEARTRRFYRARDVHDIRVVQVEPYTTVTATYRGGRGEISLLSAYCRLEDLRDLLGRARPTLVSLPEDVDVVVDVETWRTGPRPSIGDLADELRTLLDGVDVGRRLRRVDLTVTSGGDEPEHLRTQHVTFRHDDRSWVEDPRYRNLHPMIAKRLDLWRWANFELERLSSAEDVYVFAATARDNPTDVRLVACAEVRDLTPARDSTGGVTGYPLLERMFCESLTTLRHELAARPLRARPLHNRVVLHVRPPWDVPGDMWRGLAHRLAPMSNGLGVEKVQVRVQLADTGNDAVIEMTGVADHGVTVRIGPPGDDLIPAMTGYDQRVAKADRAGVPYPYELLRMLTPPPGAPADFPVGTFQEYDLEPAGDALVPVDRAPGGNTCGIVTGVITTMTQTVPEGMSRVVLLGDPTRGLGNLAEAECRRILAAVDLAEAMRLPVEWYAVSSGARIAMDSGTENMDWIAAVLRRLIEFTQAGGEVNVVVTGINVGAQPYWNAEATMLMHTRGVLVMTPSSAMVLTGKSSLDYSGGVSAEDNTGIGGFERVMGPNGQGQYWAPTLADACALLLRHYDYSYVVPGEQGPRRRSTADPVDRDVRTAPHAQVDDCDFDTVGDVFSAERNPDRKKPFDMRSVMRAVADADAEPLERWARWRDAETAIVWDARVGGIPVCMLGIESHSLPRSRFVPADGPPSWTSGTLFPQSSRKLARAINGASGNRPLLVLANLSGFDGSPESMRKWQLEYGAEIGRAITNFRGPIVFVVVSRYHGGAFVVFSKKLNDRMEIAAVEGSFASVIGGAPAAAVVFARDVGARTDADPAVVAARGELAAAAPEEQPALRQQLARLVEEVRAAKLKEVADEFDAVHDIRRAQRVGSVDLIVPARELRPYVVGALERGLAVPAGAPASSAR